MEEIRARLLAIYDEAHSDAFRLAVLLSGGSVRAEQILVGAFADLQDELRSGEDNVPGPSRLLHHVLRRAQPLAPSDPPVPPRTDDDLLATVRGLPDQQRRAVMLHCGLGLSGPPLARALDLPPSQAQSQLKRGLAAVAARLEGHR